MLSLVACLAASTSNPAINITLLTFDGTPASTFPFIQLNDPVMGGRSRGAWSVNTSAGGFGVMDGEVVTVPSLHAPGFIKAAADGTFRDASAAASGSLELLVRSSTPGYAGFRVALASGTLAPSYACAGGGSIPLSRGCFKAKFAVPPGSNWARVSIPFPAFSDLWSPATGEHTRECSEQPPACLTAKRLKAIKRVELWAEGANGPVHLECKSISAVASTFGIASTSDGASISGAASISGVAWNPDVATPAHAANNRVSKKGWLTASTRPRAISTLAPIGTSNRPPSNNGESTASIRPPAEFDTCSAQVQPSLRYGISGRPSPDVPAPVGASESLAEAVCCDVRARPYAEPRFLFAAPDISLFKRLDPSGPTTFYDSVCGIPLFRAPVNRTIEAFRNDTQEHGWPSFRSDEVVKDNVLTDVSTGLVSSKCGTHLGSYLPDEKGPRWCMDLACIAGRQMDSRAVA
jgi:hypothetical protein